MEASLTRVKERLEKETAAHLEMKARVSELEDRNIQLEHQANCERGERHRLEQLVSSGSSPDDAKVTLLLNRPRIWVPNMGLIENIKLKKIILSGPWLE